MGTRRINPLQEYEDIITPFRDVRLTLGYILRKKRYNKFYILYSRKTVFHLTNGSMYEKELE